MRDVNHCTTKKIARQPDDTVFVLEDLSGIRTQRRGKKLNKWLSSWSFHQFEQFLSYKAEALGKRVVFVDARYTSQKCSRCGHRSSENRKKSRFRCSSCGYTAHADINAAVNLRDTYILSLTQIETREQGSVNAPYGSGAIGSQSQAASPCGCGELTHQCLRLELQSKPILEKSANHFWECYPALLTDVEISDNHRIGWQSFAIASETVDALSKSRR